MEKNLKYAVLTGDIINSSKLNNLERTQVLEFLKSTFRSIEKTEGKVEKLNENYAITRGDSFQIISKRPKDVLKYSILLRTGLRGLFKKDVPELCDARISIGIGKIDYWGETISESDGDAFRFSGRELDIDKNKTRLLIKTENKKLNEELEIYLILLNAIIIDWTSSKSQMIYEKILEPKQIKIVKKMGISASAVSKALHSAHWEAIETLIRRFETIIK